MQIQVEDAVGSVRMQQKSIGRFFQGILPTLLYKLQVLEEIQTLKNRNPKSGHFRRLSRGPLLGGSNIDPPKRLVIPIEVLKTYPPQAGREKSKFKFRLVALSLQGVHPGGGCQKRQLHT